MASANEESLNSMTASQEAPDHVHFVGSVGFDTVDEVFRTLGPMFKQRLRRIPDGEPGARRGWIYWQYAVLRNNPFLAPDQTTPPTPMGAPKIGLAEGVTAEQVRFGELGYAREARASYLDFCAARDRGEISRGVRFQVCFPTPMGVIYAFCSPRALSAIEAAYEAAMIREVEAVCRAIPHQDLCIQWDFCGEMVIIDGQLPERSAMPNASKELILQRMQRLCAAVPNDVDLGIHLCYGDMDAKHIVQPRDAGKLVEVANALAQTVTRPLSYIHMPVPIDRSDDGYFKPLDGLRLPPTTELYLGVVHAQDGIAGTQKRIAAARNHVKNFGIASECGISRARGPELVHRFLDVYAGASRPTNAS